MRRAAGRYRALIRLTPLIDTVLVLAIFLMLVSSVSNWRAIDRGTLVREAADAPMEETPLVEILPDGFRMSGETVSLDVLATRVERLAARRPDLRLVVRPSPGVSMEQAIQVLDRLEVSGLTRISLIHPPVSEP